jgi:NAD dependent epimerase/dehydratase family enzyme
MSWIHIQDLARIIGECVANPEYRGPLNAVAPEPVRNSGALVSSQRVSGAALSKLGFQFEFTKLADALNDIYQG